MCELDESILVTIKKMLGMDEDYKPFDMDIVVNINSAMLSLTQLGVGPKKGFHINGYDESWGDFLGKEVDLNAAKTFIYLKVKMLFDPPTNSFVMDAMKQQAEELGWRLNIASESVETFDFME